MAKKKQEKKSFISTKQKADNSIEVSVNKSPAKTKTGVVLVWVICACTLLVPVAGLIITILLAGK